MTLIIGLKCTDGLVFAADSMSTEASPLTGSAIARHEADKLCICDDVIWGASGSVGIRQDVEDALLTRVKTIFKKASSAPQVRAGLVELIKPILLRRYGDSKDVANILKDFRQPVMPPLANFIFGARIANEFELINIEADFNGEVVTSKHCATGSGAKVGQSLLRRLRNQTWNTKAAEIIAYRTMNDAIHIEPSGIGQPICIARLYEADGRVKAERILGAEFDAIQASAQVWMETETEALNSLLTPQATAAAPPVPAPVGARS